MNNRKDILFLIMMLFFISLIAFFNYFVDPYSIFNNEIYNGFNHIKKHKYTNKRTIVNTDIKLNAKNKDVAFVGNCLLSHYGSGLDNVAFFTIPVVKLSEVYQVVQNISIISPNIKTIYLGVFFDDFWNSGIQRDSDSLQNDNLNYFSYKDFINLFFSWNTTKYSIETVIESYKFKKNDIKYVYPYREIAHKTYSTSFSFKELEYIKDILDFCNKNKIKLVVYYSPIHVSKKIHIYSKNLWSLNQKLKIELAKIIPFYDYSLFDNYNSELLDENSSYFIDNVHLTDNYNDVIVNDILSNNKKHSVLITSNNVLNILEKETQNLVRYMTLNPDIVSKIENVRPEDADFSIPKKN